MVKAVSKVEKKRKKKVGRKPGSPKIGGRKKGTPNVNSKQFRDALDATGSSLVELTLNAIHEIEDPAVRVEKLMALHRFAYPTLKEVELVPEKPNHEAANLAALSDENLLKLATPE